MIANWLTYCLLARELGTTLRGRLLEEAWSQERNAAMLAFTAEHGDVVTLLCSCNPRMPHIMVQAQPHRARRNSVDVVPALIGRRVEGVDIARGDRLLRIRFDDASSLVLQLYSARANMFHCSDDGTVLTPFKRTIEPLAVVGASWIDPALPLTTHLPATASDGTSAEDLAAACGYLTGTMRHVFLAACAGAPDAAPVTVLTDLLRQCELAAPRILVADDSPPVFSLLPADDFGRPLDTNDDGVLALHGLCLRLRHRFENFRSRKTALLAAISREMDRRTRTLASQPAAVEREAEAARYEKWGHLLMIHTEVAPAQPGLVVLPDIFTDPRLVVSIPVREGDSNIRSAERYYDKARNIRAGIIHSEEKRAAALARLEELEAMKHRIDSITDPDDLREELRALKEAGTSPAGVGGPKQGPALPYRTFEVGGYTVLVGKTSHDNDELTFRHARPNDIWMHARGVPGSHVVIRLDGRPKPGRDVIRLAAALAAYYSKYRNAGNVPVCYTERKYVHKMKGAPPGTVRLDREEVVMVKPAPGGEAE